MDELQIEHTGKLSSHEARLCSLERRMNCVEEMQRTLSNLATSVAVLVEQVKTISTDTGDIKTRLDIIEERPANNYRTLIWIVITAVASGIAGYFISR